MKGNRTPKMGKWGLVLSSLLFVACQAGCQPIGHWGGSALAADAGEPVWSGAPVPEGSQGVRQASLPAASPGTAPVTAEMQPERKPPPEKQPDPNPTPTGKPEPPPAGKRKIVALTFDDGPDGKYTPKVLDILKKYDVKATFFVVGTQVEKNPETALRIVREGHDIGNHSWSHKDLSKLSGKALDDQIERTQEAIGKATGGYTPDLVRAPYGSISDSFLDYLHDNDLRHVYWSVDPKDWAGTPVAAMRENIRKHTHSGSVILLHSFGGRKHAIEHTLALLPLVIEDLRKAGYEFGTVDEMIEAGQVNVSVIK